MHVTIRCSHQSKRLPSRMTHHIRKVCPRLLRLRGERRGEEAEDKDGCERNAPDRHAATVACWLSTAAIFRQPSSLRNLIGPAIR